MSDDLRDGYVAYRIEENPYYEQVNIPVDRYGYYRKGKVMQHYDEKDKYILAFMAERDTIEELLYDYPAAWVCYELNREDPAPRGLKDWYLGEKKVSQFILWCMKDRDYLVSEDDFTFGRVSFGRRFIDRIYLDYDGSSMVIVPKWESWYLEEASMWAGHRQYILSISDNRG